MTPQVPAPSRVRAPCFWRRIASFVYEGVVLFGVVMLTGLCYAGITQQRHALQGSEGLKVVLFVVLGSYFVWFWTHGGQTAAMKTWHIRLVSNGGGPPSRLQACLRYLLCWLWFLPALITTQLAGFEGAITFGVTLVAGVMAYGGLALLRTDRQYWHDVVCGTRLVDVRVPADVR